MPVEKEKFKASLFGGFADNGYISTDVDKDKTDPYIKAEPIPSRYLGKNFKAHAPKSGKTVDVFFDHSFPTLASTSQNKDKPDVYEDPGRADRRLATESKKKNIDQNKDFKLASYPKKPIGSGSFVGTFANKPFDHLPEYKVTQRGDPAVPPPKPQPKNIVTKPGKKGTYGFIGTTFSNVEPPKNHDEFDAVRKKEQELWKKSKEKMIGTGTFKIFGSSKKTFDEQGISGISSVYNQFEPKEEKAKKNKKPAPEPKKVHDKPFIMASGPKNGQYGCMNAFPNSRDDKPDPYDTLRLKRQEDKKKAPKPLGPAWKPVSGQKSAVIKSLLKKFY